MYFILKKIIISRGKSADPNGACVLQVLAAAGKQGLRSPFI